MVLFYGPDETKALGTVCVAFCWCGPSASGFNVVAAQKYQVYRSSGTSLVIFFWPLPLKRYFPRQHFSSHVDWKWQMEHQISKFLIGGQQVRKKAGAEYRQTNTRLTPNHWSLNCEKWSWKWDRHIDSSQKCQFGREKLKIKPRSEFYGLQVQSCMWKILKKTYKTLLWKCKLFSLFYLHSNRCMFRLAKVSSWIFLTAEVYSKRHPHS